MPEFGEEEGSRLPQRDTCNAHDAKLVKSAVDAAGGLRERASVWECHQPLTSRELPNPEGLWRLTDERSRTCWRGLRWRILGEMSHALVTAKRWLAGRSWAGVAVVVAFTLTSCGGASTMGHSPLQPTPAGGTRRERSTTYGSKASIPGASAVSMTPTPPAALADCLQSRLLRPVCPRLVPSSLDSGRRYTVADGCANAVHITIKSRGCTLPAWSYETFAPLPGQTAGTRIDAWDGTSWFRPSYVPMIPPPYHVHVDIEAAAGAPPPSILSPSFAGAKPAGGVTDGLLNPNRNRAVSFGWVRWFGRHGQLVLAPTGANGGGEQAGHLIFYFTAGGVYYDISLHAWASKERLTGRFVRRILTTEQPGPALPHVIATLKAIVGSLTR